MSRRLYNDCVFWVLAKHVLTAAYVVGPAAALASGLVEWWRRRRLAPLLSFLLATAMVLPVGLSLLFLNAHVAGGSIAVTQSLQFLYLIVGVICLLRWIDRLLRTTLFHLTGVKVDSKGQPLPTRRARAIGMLFLERLGMMALVIPYVIALLVVYRPRVLANADAQARGSLSYADVAIRTRDGVRLAAWWVPAQPGSDVSEEADRADWGSTTIVICHGVGSCRQQQLPLASFLAENGFNALLFDFRAHGQSQGNLFSYGSRERLDVLAAVSWVRANHPEKSRRIFGIGVNTGAAALLAAAAEPGTGANIDGLVLYEPFARFRSLASTTAGLIFPQPVTWLVDRIGLPVAGLHVGENLQAFAPVEAARAIWPRPVLVVHGRGNTFIPALEEMDVYAGLSAGRQQYWPAGNPGSSRRRLEQATSEFSLLTEAFRQWIGTADRIADDPAVRDVTLQFLQTAVAVPFI